MADDNRCAKCGSDRIIPAARLIDRGHLNFDAGDLRASVAADPDALIFSGTVKADLRARVCGACGYAELYAGEPAALWLAHIEAAGR